MLILSFPTVHDEEGNEVQLTHGNYISLVESKNRTVRKEAYEALYSVYEQYQHLCYKTLQTNVKVHNYNAKVRDFLLRVKLPCSLLTLFQKVFMIA